MNSLPLGEFNPSLPDAAFDLDGTLFKFTVLQEYTNWLSEEKIFAPIPNYVEEARLLWKTNENNEANYKNFLDKLVQFFIGQIAGQPTATLEEAANTVAEQTSSRQWDITRNIINKLKPTHNVMAISLLPEWLIPAFTKDLGFVAMLGCTYVSQDGKFTGEAYSIDKASVYTEYRSGYTGKLDIAMGDTMGDLSIFGLARRPIAFNPSFTLMSELDNGVTEVAAWKDSVQVTNHNPGGSLSVERFHCSEVDKVLGLVHPRTS